LGKAKRAALVILTAQRDHWKRKHSYICELLPDDSKIRRRAELEHVMRLAEVNAGWLRRENRDSRKRGWRPRWAILDDGQVSMPHYGWSAAQHRGPELREALGYGERQFSNARHKLKLKPRKNPKSRGGRELVFSASDARCLVEFRLGNVANDKRGLFAEELWKSVRWHSDAAELLGWRTMLIKAGARCDHPAEAARMDYRLGTFLWSSLSGSIGPLLPKSR
jgi:hypothetical protein